MIYMIAAIISSLLLLCTMHLCLKQVIAGIAIRWFLLAATTLTLFPFIVALFVPSDVLSPATTYFSVFIATLIVFHMLFHREQINQCIYLIALILGVTTILAASILWPVSIIAVGEIDDVIIDLATNCLLLAVCLLANAKGLLARIFQGIIQLSKLLKAILLTSVWISASLATLFSVIHTVTYGVPGLYIMGTLIASLIIILGIMCPLLIINYLSKSHYKSLSDVMDRQVRAQLAHYETMSQMNEGIKRFRHDYSNLRIGLVGALRSGDVDGALSLLQTGEMSLGEVDCPFETGNYVLDALLSEMSVSAAKVNARIEFEGASPPGMLGHADICVIFGNLADNAIEACAQCPEDEPKLISIRTKLSDGLLFIVIGNPVPADVLIVGGSIATTKKDKQSHGIGLSSVRTAAKKYSGTVSLSCEGRVFRVEVCLDFNRLPVHHGRIAND